MMTTSLPTVVFFTTIPYGFKPNYLLFERLFSFLIPSCPHSNAEICNAEICNLRAVLYRPALILSSNSPERNKGYCAPCNNFYGQIILT
jgi:hypothetical protein